MTEISNPPYKIYISITPPYKIDPSSAGCPIEKLFTSITSGIGFDKFGNTVVRIAQPLQPITVDTKIGLCGKTGCVGCTDKCKETYKIRALTPDYEIWRSVLAKWKAGGEVGGVVIIKSSTVTSSATPDNLAEALTMAETSLAKEGQILDLFYFAKWLDRPDQYNTLGIPLPGGGHVVRTWNPHGFQAVAISKEGMLKLEAAFNPDINPVVCRTFSQTINTMIQRGSLVAATTTPSLLQYNSMQISLRTPYDSEFSHLKTAECRAETHPERPLNRRISADLSLFWVVIVIFVACVSTIILLKMGAVVIPEGH